MAGDDSSTNVRNGRAFVTTRWSMVLAAGRTGSDESQNAMAHLCQAYWYPLYAFLRRQGRSPHDAEDLTQGFFAHLLEKNAFQSVEPQKGRFRSFLLSSFKNYLLNDWDRKNTAKRGGRCCIVSLNEEQGEDRYLREPAHDATPERIYEQSWAMIVLEAVFQQLRREYEAAGKKRVFDVLREHLVGHDDRLSYAELSKQLSMNEGALRMAVLRMRRQFGELLRAEIAQTIGNPKDVDEELRHLLASLAR